MSVRFVTIIGLSLVIAAVVLLRMEERETEVDVPVSPPLRPTYTEKDAAEVFKRAFWKRPTENDKILHAVRREWADAEGIQKWQWFIAVEPSDQLAGYLKQNPFRLNSPKGKTMLPTEAPEWFPKSGRDFEVQRRSNGEMIIMIEKESGRLYAFGQGFGFAEGGETPEASPVGNEPGTTGRLPTNPPPTPKDR